MSTARCEGDASTSSNEADLARVGRLRVVLLVVDDVVLVVPCRACCTVADAVLVVADHDRHRYRVRTCVAVTYTETLWADTTALKPLPLHVSQLLVKLVTCGNSVNSSSSWIVLRIS